MKKLIVIATSLLFVTGSRAQQVINDPNAQVREAKDFHGIHVSSAFTVYISEGTTESVAVSSTVAKDMEKIKVFVKDGILHIKMENNFKLNIGTQKREFKAYVTYKKLDELDISGACDVFVNGVLKAENLSIDLSGASDLKAKLDVEKLSVDLSGASDAVLSGSAKQVNIDASGASSFKGFDLATDICNLDASGASDIKITVNKELSAEASGASDIHYKGSGVIKDVRNSGSSSISKS
jgi:hypothetical protein